MIRKKLLTILVFLFLLSGFLHPITAMTQDLGRHLLTGKIILQSGSVPKTNLFSFTYPNFPFINHHWFSEVVFYLVQQLAGFNGLLMLTIFVVLLAFWFIFSFAKKESSIFAITFASLLYFRVLFERTDVRPEIFSFLFLSLFIAILYKNREKHTRFIFLLPIIELFWVNTHIYFPIGLAVIGLFLLSVIPNLIRDLRSNEMLKRVQHDKAKTLFFVLLLSILATMLNPNGISGALYPFHAFQNYGYQIEENQNIFFLWNYFNGKTTILFFFFSATALFISLFVSLRKTRLVDWLLALFFTTLTIIAERNFPLFVFGTFIAFTHALSSIKFAPSKLAKNVIAIVFVVIIFWQIKDVAQTRGFGFGLQTGARYAADFFLKNNLKGPIFNNFDIGSYLEYRLYPKERVFVDGRPEAYPVSFFQDVYIPMQIDKTKFDLISEKYNINTIFFAHTDFTPWADAFFSHIFQNEKWKIVYLDDFVIIFVKNIAENKAVIEKFGMTPQTLKISNMEETDMQSLLRLANFFKKAGWTTQQLPLYQKILTIDPNSCFALYNSYVLLAQKSNDQAKIFATRFQQVCK